MNRPSNTALGIEISSGHVAMALVRREKRRLILAKGAMVRLPEGVIADGRLTDPSALAKAIAQARCRCLGLIGYPGQVGLAIPGHAVKMHLLDMPDPLPPNLRQFVTDEVGQFISIPSEAVVIDYGPIGPKHVGRLLAGISDGQFITQLLRPCSRAVLNVQVVEPPCLAVLRALTGHAKSHAGNVLVILVGRHSMQLCVFRAGQLDFVRTQVGLQAWEDRQGFLEHVLAQINEVIQFYSVESTNTADHWYIHIICQDKMVLAEEALQERLGSSQIQLEVLTAQQAGQIVQVDCKDPAILNDTTPAAIGVAMGLLVHSDDLPRLNLLPAQILQVRQLTRQLTLAALAVVVVILCMGLITMGLVRKIRSIEEYIAGRHAVAAHGQTAQLVDQQRRLEEQFRQVSRSQQALKQIASTHGRMDLAALLADVRLATPDTVAITRLTVDTGQMFIDGYASDHGSIKIFIDRLETCRQIGSSSLASATAGQVNGNSQVFYRINCTLRQKET